jgi:hypothetical protein
MTFHTHYISTFLSRAHIFYGIAKQFYEDKIYCKYHIVVGLHYPCFYTLHYDDRSKKKREKIKNLLIKITLK